MIAANTTLRLSYSGYGLKVLSERAGRVLDQQPTVTAEDIRIHAWINKRLAVIHRERNSVWAKLKRAVFSR